MNDNNFISYAYYAGNLESFIKSLSWGNIPGIEVKNAQKLEEYLEYKLAQMRSEASEYGKNAVKV